jgi:hypothetical protein
LLLSDGAPDPWHEFVDAAVGPSFGDLLHDAAYVGEGFDAVQFAGLCRPPNYAEWFERLSVKSAHL